MCSAFVTFGKQQANDYACQVIADQAFFREREGQHVWFEKNKTAAKFRIILSFLWISAFQLGRTI